MFTVGELGRNIVEEPSEVLPETEIPIEVIDLRKLIEKVNVLLQLFILTNHLTSSKRKRSIYLFI